MLVGFEMSVKIGIGDLDTLQIQLLYVVFMLMGLDHASISVKNAVLIAVLEILELS